jgi:hypothetical protein
MSGMFSVTYEIITNESAEHGDYVETGYIDENISLREAMRLVYPQEDCDGWFREVDARIDYATGEYKYHTLHPPRNITPSSYNRLRKILGFKENNNYV